MTSELAGKFRSKSDFLYYCSNQVSEYHVIPSLIVIVQLQLYLPPDSFINKDYMKQIFEDKKGFLEYG